MPYVVNIQDAQSQFPDYVFVNALTPSEQKAAFHVKDSEGNDLCLKLINPDYSMDRLDREIQALQAIDHPNVVKLLEYTFSARPGHHRHFILEEFIEGTDLSTRLAAGNAWPRHDASDFFAALLDGLFALKQIHVVHRDLKPSNIRVRLDRTPVIIDFGLARHLDLSDLTETSAGAAIGTPLYFSPEQFAGNKRDIDHRTDLFAVGLLLYQALIARHPFHQGRMSYQQLQDAVCNSTDHLQHSDFLDLPKQWRILLQRLLAKERAKRPTDAAQAAAILRRIGGI